MTWQSRKRYTARTFVKSVKGWKSIKAGREMVSFSAWGNMQTGPETRIGVSMGFSLHVSLHNQGGSILSAKSLFICQKYKKWNTCRMEWKRGQIVLVVSGPFWNVCSCGFFATRAYVRSVFACGEIRQKKRWLSFNLLESIWRVLRCSYWGMYFRNLSWVNQFERHVICLRVSWVWQSNGS